MTGVLEFEQEPIKGIPGLLPASERIIWQGTPSWRSIMLHVFHVRWVAAYFGVIMAWRAYAHLSAGHGLVEATTSAAWLGVLGVMVIAILAGFALLMKRTTVYTITSKRAILRFGLVVPIAINVPFAQVAAADVKRFADGTGEIPIAVGGDQQFAYWMMWPHARRWHFIEPQPMMRAVPEAVKVAGILASAIEASLPAGELAQVRAAASRSPAAVSASKTPSSATTPAGGMAQPA